MNFFLNIFFLDPFRDPIRSRNCDPIHDLIRHTIRNSIGDLIRDPVRSDPVLGFVDAVNYMGKYAELSHFTLCFVALQTTADLEMCKELLSHCSTHEPFVC